MSITFTVIASIAMVALLPAQLQGVPTFFEDADADPEAISASELLETLQHILGEKKTVTMEGEIALAQGGKGFTTRDCYKSILSVNPDLARFNSQYKNNFHIEIVCAHPVPECTRVALKQPGQHLKYVELCKKSGEYRQKT